MKTLTKSELAGMAAAIDARDRELRDELHAELVQSGDQRYLDLAGSVHDSADESAANELIDVENTLIQRHVRELRAIDAARTRLADGTVDECIDCGNEIGLKRLMANPVALRCIDCQNQFEKLRTHPTGAHA